MHKAMLVPNSRLSNRIRGQEACIAGHATNRAKVVTLPVGETIELDRRGVD